MKKVMPIKVNDVNVHIMCPFCGKEHIHGSCGGKNYGGSRVAHCMEANGEEYEIVELTVGQLKILYELDSLRARVTTLKRELTRIKNEIAVLSVELEP